jgi:hypothetical protein
MKYLENMVKMIFYFEIIFFFFMDELITLAKFIADESRGYNNLAMFSILSFNNSPE